MLVTQKKQYALRAIYELAKNKGGGPLKTAQIAQAQAIPVRFLEIILNHLKKAGLVSAKRGVYGGYRLKRDPDKITVGDIFRALGDENDATACVSCFSQCDCPFYGDCAFIPLWTDIQTAIDDIYDRTTVRMLMDNEHLQKNQLFFRKAPAADKS